MPLGEHADGALGGDPGGQRVLQLGHGALQGGDPRASTGSASASAAPDGAARRAAGGAVGFGQGAELLGDEVGQRQPLDQVRGVLGCRRGRSRTSRAEVRVERDRRSRRLPGPLRLEVTRATSGGRAGRSGRTASEPRSRPAAGRSCPFEGRGPGITASHASES